MNTEYLDTIYSVACFDIFSDMPDVLYTVFSLLEAAALFEGLF